MTDSFHQLNTNLCNDRVLFSDLSTEVVYSVYTQRLVVLLGHPVMVSHILSLVLYVKNVKVRFFPTWLQASNQTNMYFGNNATKKNHQHCILYNSRESNISETRTELYFSEGQSVFMPLTDYLYFTYIIISWIQTHNHAGENQLTIYQTQYPLGH